MNSIRDPFSIRNPSALHILRQPIRNIHAEVARTGAAVQRTAQKAQEALPSSFSDAVDKVEEAMSGFSVPRNVPSFSAAQRELEDRVWSLKSGKGSRDLPLYKDKPYYHSARRRGWRRKRYWVLVAALVVTLWWLGWFGRESPLRVPERTGRPVVVGDGAPVDWDQRREMVREAFKESWAAYERDAWGFDEYKPLSRSGRQMVPNGMGWIIVDALDTMMIMNLTTELAHAREWVEHSLTYNQDHAVNVFETTIRMLGGLLSAHYLSTVLGLVPEDKKNPDLYLEKATDLADRLLGAYESPSGVPFASVNLATSEGIKSHADAGASSTAEAASLQLEMKYLSKLTGEVAFWQKAEKVISIIDDNGAKEGLVPIFIYATTGKFRGNEIRLGSRGDSYYEYLIKQYLQTGMKEEVYSAMYRDAMDGVKRKLVAKSHPSQLTFIGELPSGISGAVSPKMDHLVCFMPGTLALGATSGLTVDAARNRGWDQRNEEDFTLAVELMRTCYEMYNVTATGLAPEIAWFHMESDPDAAAAARDRVYEPSQDIIIKPADRHNLQRPETVESLFVMWRITRDPIYREWGWRIFQSFVQYTKVETGGYTSLNDVTEVPPSMRDNMESFWLAETLKYLYLLFSPDDLLPLDKVVFNTEAHPFPVFDMGTHFKTGWTRKPRDAAGNIIKSD